VTALPDWDIASDAELASAAAAGDRGAFAGIYDRYADRLHDFCVGMLRDRDAAADCVQDVFCAAADRLHQLRDAAKLRPWLYAIARNECLRVIRARGRERVFDEVPEAVSADAGPETIAARSELASLVAEAAGGLSNRDREVLELAYRHGLDGPELAEALGVSATNAKKMAQRLRETIERSLGALLVSRRVRSNPGACAELSMILAGWDGRFTVLMRKRIARHIESCPICDEQRSRMVSPAALLGAAPVFIPAPAWLRQRTLDKVQLTPAGHVAATGTSHTAPDDGTARSLLSRPALPVAVFVAGLVALLALTVVWVHRQNARISPADVTKTSAPTSAPNSPRQTEAPRVIAPSATSPGSPPPSPGRTVPSITTVPPVPTSVPPPPVTTTIPPITTAQPPLGPSSPPSTREPTTAPVKPTKPPPVTTTPPAPPVTTTSPPPSTKPTRPTIFRPPAGPIKPPSTTQGPVIY
jgi:RNA polymerase sigma factor (sigma-70 family)